MTTTLEELLNELREVTSKVALFGQQFRDTVNDPVAHYEALSNLETAAYEQVAIEDKIKQLKKKSYERRPFWKKLFG